MSRPTHLSLAERAPSPSFETNWAALYGAAGLGVVLVAATVVSHQLSDVKPAAARLPSGNANVVAGVFEPQTVEVVQHPEPAVAKVPTAFTDQQPVMATIPPDVAVARIPIAVAKEFAPAVAKRPRENSITRAAVVQSAAYGRWTSASRFEWPRGEYDLVTELQKYTPVAALDSVEGTSSQLLRKSVEAASSQSLIPTAASEQSRFVPGEARLQQLLATRPDLSGLPFRMGVECVANKEEIEKKFSVSRTIGRLKVMRSRLMAKPSEELTVKFARDLSQYLSQYENHFRDGDLVSVFVQMLQTDAVPVRQSLVEQLAAIDSVSTSMAPEVQNVALGHATGKAESPLDLNTYIADYRATEALARLSVFDLSPEVRKTALAVLKNRQADAFRHELLAALRYPWPPIADHAAAALVELKDVGSVPELVDMLDEPDPRAPYRSDKNEWVVRELVCVNHLRNCLLCHPPAHSPRDELRGLIPTPGKPIPVAYYHSSQGDFVRADVTFLRQDFSVNLPVENHGPWPREQRFDFMIRTRRATADELANRASAQVPAANPYPQRDAVLYALRELTDEDFGEDAEAWRRFAIAYRPTDANSTVDFNE